MPRPQRHTVIKTALRKGNGGSRTGKQSHRPHRKNRGHRNDDDGDATPIADPRERMRDLQREADRVCVLILSSELPAIDIEIEKNKVRERCLALYPDREGLYEE